MLKNYFKIAIRNLFKNRVYTIINVMGITLGISAAMVIYTVISNETNFDSFHSKASNTYRIVQHNHTADGTNFWNTTAYPLAEALRKDFPQLEVTQASGPVSSKISVESDNASLSFEEEKVLFADKHFLSVFDFKGAFSEGDLWLAGNPESAFDHPNAVVITHTASGRYFGEETERQEGVIGKTIKINGRDNLVVTGVIRDPPPNTSLSFEILITYKFFKAQNESLANNWSGNHQGTTFVVLPDEVNVAGFQKALPLFKAQYLNPQDNKRIEYFLQPLNEIHTNPLYGSSPGGESYVVGQNILKGLMFLAFFIVLIACINYTNLATVQSLKRNREAGVRKVLGASRKQLFFQYMTEVFLITLSAAILSVFVGEWAINQLNREVSFTQFNFITDQDFLLFGAGILVTVTLVAGAYPSLVLSKQPPVRVLRNELAVSKGGLFFRRLLIVFQFSVAQLLIAATVIVASQMHYFRNTDYGYNKDAVLTLKIPDTDAGKQEAFRQRLLQNPAVEHISFSSGPPTPYGRQYGTSFRRPHEPAESMRMAEMKMIDTDYINVYKLNLVAGSWIGEGNKIEGFNGFVVNESLVRMLSEDPAEIIGKSLTINEGEAPVIGVVKDFHNDGLQYEITPCILFYWGTGFLDEAGILMAAHGPEGQDLENTLAHIEESWKEVFPGDEFNFAFLDERLAQHYRVESLVYKAFQLAAGISVFIGCLGLFGLVSFVAVQRKKEVGIRKVLGASVMDIFGLLTGDFMKLVFIAIIIATPVSWYLMQKWLQDFAYRISPDWWYFLGAGALTMSIALITAGYQAVNAARVNPVKNLRTE